MRSLILIGIIVFCCDISASRIRIKRRCTYDSECEENAFCRQQIECECKSGYSTFVDPTTRDELCLKGQLALGDECVVNDQCQVKLGLAAECSSLGDCRCRQGAHYLNSTGRCYNTSKIGEACLTSDYCHIEQPGVLLTCDRGKCVCPRGHHGNRSGTRCITSVRLGETCSFTEQCVTPKSICYEECRCDVHHIENGNKTQCLPEAERVGDACIETPQCSKAVTHSECVQNLCQCIELYHPGTQGYKCWKTAYVGHPCEDDNECIPTSIWDSTVNLDWAKCIDGVCTCAADTTVDDSGSCISSYARSEKEF